MAVQTQVAKINNIRPPASLPAHPPARSPARRPASPPTCQDAQHQQLGEGIGVLCGGSVDVNRIILWRGGDGAHSPRARR